MFILLSNRLTKVLLSTFTTLSLLATGALSGIANANSQITVHSGDTLKGLSKKYHVSTYELVMDNHLSDQGSLHAGEQLTLPNRTDNSNRSTENSQDTQDNNKDHQNSVQDKLSPAEQAAKDWISFHESRNKYNVNNGKYYGKFQLDPSLLHGDYSKANQEKTADHYVHQRYGSWVHAKNFWQSHNWY